MNELGLIPPLRGALITEVTLVDAIERSERGAYKSESLPGHLIHVCTGGEVEQCSGGVTQHFGAGDSIWYYENEPVQGKVLRAPWTFYTVNFRAPLLPPPPLSARVKPIDSRIVERMQELLKTWRDIETPGVLRHLRVYVLLLELIADLTPDERRHHSVDESTQLWWEIENQIRGRLDQPIDLALLEKLSGRSQRSIARASCLATGMPPMKRVKQIRLSYARGLTRLSDFSMTEIAYRIGYSRVQEFSRDYHVFFGQTPTQERSAGPHYRHREFPHAES